MKTKLMGILNLTNDSFSGDGLLNKTNFISETLQTAELMLKNGAEILDLGASSSRPGATPLSWEEEWLRLSPILKELKNLKSIISIDTYHAKTAKLSLENGANWINSIWGFQKDPELLAVIKDHQVPFVLMHNSSEQGMVQTSSRNGNFYGESKHQEIVAEVIEELSYQIEDALSKGIKKEQIIIDPGIGFGKTPEQNLILMKNLTQFKRLGYPVLIGPSRKSFIGLVLDLPTEQRLSGTLAACAIAVQQEIDILRIHDVLEVAQAVKITEAIRDA